MPDQAHQELVKALVESGQVRWPDSVSAHDSHSLRRLVQAVLDATARLGYRIEQIGKVDQKKQLPAGNEVISDWLARLQSVEDLSLPDLLSVWKATADLPRGSSPALHLAVAEMILKKGEPLIAYDVLASALRHWPDDVALRRLQALALARSGAADRAGRLLQTLVESGIADGDTLGMLARTHKDRWQHATDATARQRHLETARDLYTRGLQQALASGQVADAIYTGINAAAMAFLLGEKQAARGLAAQVHQLCQEFDAGESNYWAQASIGEANLILGRYDDASQRYAAAARLGQGNYAELDSTRRNARLLLEAAGEPINSFDALFQIPAVVVFAGHMIDQPDRPDPRFPESLEVAVQRKVWALVDRLNVGFGFSSAACGADILFLEAMHQRGAETHVILPLPITEFERASVALGGKHGWEDRFRVALQRAARVVIASEKRNSESPVVFEYANRIQTGLARLKAETLGTDLVPVAVWDGRMIQAPGGTASQIQAWRRLGLQPEVIDLAQLQGVPVRIPEGSSQREEIDAEELGQTIRAILFADVVGFTSLSDEEIPKFVKHFMQSVAHWISNSPYQPQSKNSWGDALYFVFADVVQAGQCGLALSEYMRTTDWRSKGFRRDLTLRIGLHAGPVYACRDPITLQETFVGSHVSRAARIEPITPPGQVYASEAFAALAAAQSQRFFACDYVGMTTLAKKYGAFPTYHVRRVS
jgi:class 3 adenylate cyclase/tetratricopeptide (TPR) repeat protein